MPRHATLRRIVNEQTSSRRMLDRYALYDEIASGGMATVHLGRLLGAKGFSRTVAIKRLHPQYAKDPEFVSMFLDEARLAARIRHPNVVSTLDVVTIDGEVFLVMEYIAGEALARLLGAACQGGSRIPQNVVGSIVVGALHGLHAAHEAKSELGRPLELVHRDVSPQNILVGADGVARVLDFGIAKAIGRTHTTRDGQVKGKLRYMSPEHLTGEKVTRASDVFAASVVLWEALTSRPLFEGKYDGEIVYRILEGAIDPPSRYVPGLPACVDEVTLRGLSRDPALRFPTARDMARALEQCLDLAPVSEVGDFVEHTARAVLAQRARLLAQIESEGRTPFLSVPPSFSNASELVVDDEPPRSTTNTFGRGDAPYAAAPQGAHETGGLGDAGPLSHARATLGDWNDPFADSDTGPPPSVATGIGVIHPRGLGLASKAAIATMGAVVSLVLVVALRRSLREGSVTIISPTSVEPPSPPPTEPSAARIGWSGPAACSVPVSSAPPSSLPAPSVGALDGSPAASSALPRPASRPPARAKGLHRCDPPYVIDAQGIRHYKRECVQ